MFIKIKVFPDSPKELIEDRNSKLYFFVKQSATQNQANIAASKLLARHLGIPERKVRLIIGHHAQNKTFEILD